MVQVPRAGSDKDGATLLDFEFEAESLSGLRAAVMEAAAAAGLDDDRAIDVMLAMHELAANVIRHGTGYGRLQMQLTANALRCEVSETVGRFGPVPDSPVSGPLPVGPLMAEAPAKPSWPVEHGHGLWIVRRTADQVQVTTGPSGTVVGVVFTRPER